MGFVETYHARAHILASFFVIPRPPMPPTRRAIKMAVRYRTTVIIIRASIKSHLLQTRKRKGCQSQAQETLTVINSSTQKTCYISFLPMATQQKQLPEKSSPTHSKMAYMILPRNPRLRTFQSKQARLTTLEPASCFKSAGWSAP